MSAPLKCIAPWAGRVYWRASTKKLWVWECQQRGLNVERQVALPITYKGKTLSTPLRIDLIVGGKVIVEGKATTQYNAIFEAQTLTYLRLTGLKLGLVINFGEALVKNRIHRVVNNL